MSKKTAARNAEVREFRRALVAEVGKCECCGHDLSLVGIPFATPWENKCCIGWEIHCHEIANGPLRQKCLDKRFGLLVACWYCNSGCLNNKKAWPESRQLAALRKSRPQDYDLAAYLRLKNPNAPLAITQDEVDQWNE